MKIKANGKLYDLPSRPLELGEQRWLKREFGVAPARDELDLRDPDHIAAFLYTAMHEANPETPRGALLAAIERIREMEIVNDDGSPIREDAEELDPTLPQTADKVEKPGLEREENRAGE